MDTEQLYPREDKSRSFDNHLNIDFTLPPSPPHIRNLLSYQQRLQDQPDLIDQLFGQQPVVLKVQVLQDFSDQCYDFENGGQNKGEFEIQREQVQETMEKQQQQSQIFSQGQYKKEREKQNYQPTQKEIENNKQQTDRIKIQNNDYSSSNESLCDTNDKTKLEEANNSSQKMIPNHPNLRSRSRSINRHIDIQLPCSCQKTHCLKMYCSCFHRGQRCSEYCKCEECKNINENQEELNKAIVFVKSKANRSNMIGEDLFNSTKVWGCNCKKTLCQKRYCECFIRNIKCTDRCQCQGCENGKHDMCEDDYDQASVQKRKKRKNKTKKNRRLSKL